MNYILNDVGYDNMPLRAVPQDDKKIDKKELEKSMEKNRQLIERMRNDERYKKLIAP